MPDFAELTDHLARMDTVTIITTRSSGEEIATPIWAVVVEGAPYVRSAYGESATWAHGDSASWYRRARSGRPVAFTFADGRNAERDARAAVGDPRLQVRVVHLPAESVELDAIDAEFQAKYGYSPNVRPLLTAESRALTLRVEPNAAQSSWNDRVVSEFRSRSGAVSGYEDTQLLLLHHVGLKTGTSYVTPLVYPEIGRGYAVFASNGGSDDHPHWYRNLLASPIAIVELATGAVTISARVATTDERPAIWEKQKQIRPRFAEMERRAPREIPVVILEPVNEP